ELGLRLADAVAAEPDLDLAELLRRSRRWLREGKADADEQKRVRKLAEAIQRVQRVGSWAFANQTITQEEIAEHL
ncbi:MAG: hypothetical protein E5X96_18370, partial [Mesorhizobium sp.]